ncbi:MAG: isochorismatase family protein [Rhodobacteraceae bacterium]|nr:isochorismatase family protein [Paracoccaceae bacterium]
MNRDNTGAETGGLRDRGFLGRVGFGLRPALVVIDMQNGFTDAKQPLGSDLSAQIEPINTLIDHARRVEMPVFFTVCSYDGPDFQDAGLWIRKIAGLASLESGTANVEIDERLSRRPGDALIVKKYASCFFGTDFSSRLAARGIDTLIITGCTTSGCVRATAVDACQNGLRAIVVREAVGDRDPVTHEQNLFELDAKYADVMALSDVVDALTRAGSA